MADRPLVLFPKYAVSDRAKGSGRPQKFSKPSIGRQMDRFSPKFQSLQTIINQKNIALHDSPSGITPECALVFEIVGSVDNFYTAVKNTEGIEWMFDQSVDDIEADDDFHLVDPAGETKEGTLSGKVYCVMTNKRALDELISLWRQYVADPDMKFQRGYTGFRDIFEQLKDVRYWSAIDRLEESNVIDYWRQDLELNGLESVKFEIELFFRNSQSMRSSSAENVRQAITNAGGIILGETEISEIAYHGLLAELPREQILNIIDNYDAVELVKVDDIMFFRPVGQVAFPISIDAEEIQSFDSGVQDIDGLIDEPVIAIFDGFPMQNHELLSGRLIVDDPLSWSDTYTVKDRLHGTAMASLVVHSDLNSGKESLGRKVYVRPIFKAYRDFNDNVIERVPDDVLLVDLIHTAVKRLFDGDGSSGAVAPTVRIINLSLGDPARQFTNVMSPLARLLDWLSFYYNVLFIVSAGNHNTGGIDIGMPFRDFKTLSNDERQMAVLKKLDENCRNQRLLSPAESINCLTVGAVFQDYCSVTENDRFVLPYTEPLPSPISAIGLGYNRSIKPDVFFNGGRKFLSESYISTNMNWVRSFANPPGCRIACPGNDASNSSCAYSFGTSDAAAQISHEGGKCYEILNEVFVNQFQHQIPHQYSSILLKTMLVHGSTWDVNTIIGEALDSSEKRVYRWLGNGVPKIERVHECAKNRISLIGFGAVEMDKAHVYKVPIPIDFASGRYFRKLTVTLSYFTSTIPTRQKYRSSQVWFSLENNSLVNQRVNTDDKVVKRGTVQHEIFTGESAVVWDPNDSLEIKVNCKDDAAKDFTSVDYGIMVSFEIAEEVSEQLDIDVYSQVLTKVQESVQVQKVR